MSAPPAVPRAPTTAPSSPTATCTARAHRARCWNSARSPAPPPAGKPQTTTARPPSPRTGGLQARPDHRRRRRRLPPGPVPGRHGQDPLPAAARLDDAGPGPARDPHPARVPPGLLHPADPHRPARGERQDAPDAISHFSFSAEISLDAGDPGIRKRRVQARVARRRRTPQDVSQ